MDAFFDNPSNVWFLIGFSLLAIEAFVLGLSSGALLFGGLAALLTGALFAMGVLEGSAFGIAPLAITGVGSAVLAMVLWKPLKALQNRKDDKYEENNSDFVGLTFTLTEDLAKGAPCSHSYSGVTWKVELEPTVDQVVPAGSQVEVTRVRVGGFTVKPKL